MKYTPIAVLLLLFSCTTKEQADKISYFDFDEVIHYSLDISDYEILQLIDIDNKSVQDSLLIEAILDPKPTSIEDSDFFENLKNSGFAIQTINEDYHSRIDHIFSEKNHEESFASACIPFYRDYLLFKQNNKPIGIAIICFTCSQTEIFGTDRNTSDFGQSGDYAKLYSILEENKKL